PTLYRTGRAARPPRTLRRPGVPPPTPSARSASACARLPLMMFTHVPLLVLLLRSGFLLLAGMALAPRGEAPAHVISGVVCASAWRSGGRIAPVVIAGRCSGLRSGPRQ